jgi:capsular polysaccharide biosynthesis protein
MIDLKNMNSNLFNVVINNLKLLIVVGIIAAILSVVFSSAMFIAPKYKSTAIVYPSNLGEYSEESPIEQMMQWFDSEKIKKSVIKENDLYSHYDIDESEALSPFYIIEEFNENITVTETKYESAEINVLDTDPEKAAKIASSMITNFNSVIRAVHKKRALEDLNSQKQRMRVIKHDLDSVSNELQKLRVDYGLIDYSTQAREVTRGYLKTIEGSNKSNINIQEILKMKENIEKKGGDFILYNSTIYELLKEFAKIHEDYSYVLNAYEREMTYTNIVSEPQVPVKKVYPVRWMIVLLSTFGAVAFAFVLLLFSTQLKSEE